MERLANNSPLNIRSFFQYMLMTLIFLVSFVVSAQSTISNLGEKYTIREIVVSGNTSFNSNTIITFSRLRKGDEIVVGGEKIGEAVKRL